MGERRSELKRRRHRRGKMLKLKSRLIAAKNPQEREVIVNKLRRLNPFWIDEPVGA